MRKQHGASLLFLMLIAALTVLVVTWMALPWFTAARNEKIESDLNRGVAPSANAHPSKAAAREQAQNVEFVEAHGGLKTMAGTEHYRALSPRCRELVDAYVDLTDKPADTATDNASVRASVADIERSFGAECADAVSTAPATASAGVQPSGSQGAMLEAHPNSEAYRALSPECRGYFDTYMSLLIKRELTPADRDRAAEADRLFSANCIDREAEAKAAESRAAQAEEGRQHGCAQKREAAEMFRAVVELTLGEEPPKPGAIDEDKRERRESLEKNKGRLAALEADIAANCR